MHRPICGGTLGVVTNNKRPPAEARRQTERTRHEPRTRSPASFFVWSLRQATKQAHKGTKQGKPTKHPTKRKRPPEMARNEPNKAHQHPDRHQHDQPERADQQGTRGANQKTKTKKPKAREQKAPFCDFLPFCENMEEIL